MECIIICGFEAITDIDKKSLIILKLLILEISFFDKLSIINIWHIVDTNKDENITDKKPWNKRIYLVKSILISLKI